MDSIEYFLLVQYYDWALNMGEEASKNSNHEALRFYSGLERALDLILDQVREKRGETSTAFVDWKAEHGIIQEYKLIEQRLVWISELSDSNGEPEDRGNNGLPSSLTGHDTGRIT